MQLALVAGAVLFFTAEINREPLKNEREVFEVRSEELFVLTVKIV